MFPLLTRLVKKVLGKVLQSHFIMVRIVGYGQLDLNMTMGRRHWAPGYLVVNGLWALVVVLVSLQEGDNHHDGSLWEELQWWQEPWGELRVMVLWGVGEGLSGSECPMVEGQVPSKQCWRRKSLWFPVKTIWPTLLFLVSIISARKAAVHTWKLRSS
jgi:hypothetical protein